MDDWTDEFVDYPNAGGVDAMTDLTVTCTDRGQHASVQLARFSWTPEPDDTGVAIWSPGEDLEVNLFDAVQENARTTKAGEQRVTKRAATEQKRRADGGLTYKLPPCPRCRRRFWLRDDRIFDVRQAGLRIADLSLVL